MNRINRIAQNPSVKAAMAAFHTQKESIIDLIIEVQQIPSPTFDEERKAAFVEQRFREIGLQDVHQDDLHNVYGRFPGSDSTHAAPVVVSAHTDTVFTADTDLSVTRNGRFIYGPGIGDNSTGVAGLFVLAEALQIHDLTPPADVWFAANICEEGLGDLRGMRAVVEKFGRGATYLVVEGGLFSQISYQGIGAKRFRVEVEVGGGHSWGDFGRPSAIHTLSQLVVAITALKVPRSPKTTFNVGVIEGGRSVNTIAQTASMLLDLRSEDAGELDKLVTAVIQIVQKAKRSDVDIRLVPVGDRPPGTLSRQAPLIKWAEAALAFVGASPITHVASSTDANIPLSLGLTAVCIGLTISGNAHRLDEYIDPRYLPHGLSQLLLLTLAASGSAG